jgi:hypothetical protein
MKETGSRARAFWSVGISLKNHDGSGARGCAQHGFIRRELPASQADDLLVKTAEFVEIMDTQSDGNEARKQ